MMCVIKALIIESLNVYYSDEILINDCVVRICVCLYTFEFKCLIGIYANVYFGVRAYIFKVEIYAYC